MTVEELHEMWGKDGPIDLTKVQQESANIPYLHNKYYTKYTNEHLRLLKLRADLKKMVRLKDDYYRGILDPEELKTLGWKPCLVKVRPAEVQKFVDNDDDVINLSLKVGYQDAIVEFLEDIVKQINNRSFQLKNIIEMRKFENGGY